MPSLSENSVVARNPAFVHVEVDGEVVAMDPTTGTCFGLDHVGARIWALIDPPRSVDAICDTLVAEYDVDRATCVAQVLDLFRDMHAEGVVEVRPHGADASSP
ncbi:MAG: PqqD family protein [Alphaproteobacteria bacterium]